VRPIPSQPESEQPPIIVIAGPTGSGKTELALRLAESIGGEIVNYDSVQIYRGFDIGSAKPSREEQARVPHHLIDIADATDEFNAADFARLARMACAGIRERGKRPILAGGTFFYLRALLSGLPEMPGRDEPIRRRIRAIADTPRGPHRLHTWLSKIDPRSGRTIAEGDRHRVERALEVWILTGRPISSWQRESEEIPSVKIGLEVERAQLGPLLDARVDAMVERGLFSETKALLELYPRSARPFGTIGYKEAAAVAFGEMTETAAVAEIRRRTRAYAKRQMTWLRSERNMQWIRGNQNDTFEAALRLVTEGKR
jgi:tRNA dimethylallyltransferase